MILFNKKLLQLKVIYFLCFAGISPLTSFGPTLAKQIGFSASSVGVVSFVSIVLSIFGRVTFGYFADKFRIHKLLLFSTTTVCGISVLFMALLAVPRQSTIKDPSKEGYVYREHNTSFEVCLPRAEWLSLQGNLAGRVCEMNCQDLNFTLSFVDSNSNASSFIDSLHQDDDDENLFCLEALKNGFIVVEDDKTVKERHCSVSTCSIITDSPSSDFVKPLFWFYLSVFCLYTMMSFIMVVFMDAICFHILDNEGGNFGNQRMFASMGWGLAALLSGFLTDYFTEVEQVKDYLPTFFVSFLLLVATATLTISFKMPKISNAVSTDWETVSKLLWSRASVIFSCWCFVIGVCSAVVWQYSFWVIENVCNDDQRVWMKSLQGAMVVVNTFFGDVPTYFFFDRILRKLGYVHCMTVTLALNAIRLFAYSILTNPVCGLFIAILDGFSFGLGYATITSYADLISTPETKAIIQAIFNSIFDGAGTSMGALCFGIISDMYSCPTAFNFCSIFAASGALLHILIRLNFNKKIIK